MDTQEYLSPSSSQNRQPSTKEWFDAMGSPLPPPKPSNKKKKLIIIVILLCLAVALGAFAVIVTLFTSPSPKKECFVQDNYKALISSIQSDDELALDHVELQKILHTQPVYFVEKTITYNSDTKDDTDEFLNAISSFYKNHHATAPITISLHADYSQNESLEIAEQRTQKLRDALLQLGVPSSIIHTEAPRRITPQDDYISDGIPTTISITPQSTCQN